MYTGVHSNIIHCALIYVVYTSGVYHTFVSRVSLNHNAEGTEVIICVSVSVNWPQYHKTHDYCSF